MSGGPLFLQLALIIIVIIIAINNIITLSRHFVTPFTFTPLLRLHLCLLFVSELLRFPGYGDEPPLLTANLRALLTFCSFGLPPSFPPALRVWFCRVHSTQGSPVVTLLNGTGILSFPLPFHVIFVLFSVLELLHLFILCHLLL